MNSSSSLAPKVIIGSNSKEQEADLAFEQCAALEREWMKVEGYVESDCYIAE